MVMKYAVIVGDGMGDRPVPALGGSTPLAVARKPNMDALAREARLGLVTTCPAGFTPGTEVCAMTLLGYDPKAYFSGRGPLEALGRGIELRKSEVAFRLNLVTVKGDQMADYSAGHIGDAEAKALVQMLDKRLGGEEIKFHPGVGYRHLMVWRGGADEVKTWAPHDIMGQPWKQFIPQGKGEKRLLQLMEDSRVLLDGHEVNRARRMKGLSPANMAWPWSPGRVPTVPGFRDKYGVGGAVISAVDIVKGLGIMAGLEPIRVPGATGYFDTNYRGKGDAAVKVLRKSDFVLVHIEAPDEAGHEGKLDEKVKAIEQIDEHILGPLMAARAKLGEVAFLVMPDHLTPLTDRAHVADDVPVLMARPGIPPDGLDCFSEACAARGSIRMTEGWELMGTFIGPLPPPPPPAQ
jgi:2,3-bisphosphoglycerate-independent phosphoglycerate mutase